jgi:shikimate kinase
MESQQLERKAIPNNLVLIGMFASGKSTVGRFLAEKIRYDFVDVDQLIERRFQKPLDRVMDLVGMKEFMKAEEEVILTLRHRHCVIAPGGSAVYYPKAMRHLKSLGTCVFLKVPLAEIKKRVAIWPRKAVVYRGGTTLPALYRERQPLYERYADLRVDSSSRSAELVTNLILRKLGAIPPSAPKKKAKPRRGVSARR